MIMGLVSLNTTNCLINVVHLADVIEEQLPLSVGTHVSPL